jgi:ubiquinone/menaquinone biosynthesis C-methylase UbiE
MASGPHGSDQDATRWEDVTDEWRDDHLPSFFARWHHQDEVLLQETTAAIIAEAAVAPGFIVLDVGCGSGIPSLELARVVGPSGSVTATDPSPILIAAVEENARRSGLTNLVAVRASASELPFPPASFDAATCHLGVMFFPDVRTGLTRMREVLRPGRRAAFVAWGPQEENAFFGAFWSAAGPYLPEPPPAEDASPPAAETPFGEPGPARFAQPGSLSAVLAAAGFADIREEARRVMLRWPESPERLREMWYDLTRLDQQVPADRKADLDADVLTAYARFAEGDGLTMPASIVVASGRA